MLDMMLRMPVPCHIDEPAIQGNEDHTENRIRGQCPDTSDDPDSETDKKMRKINAIGFLTDDGIGSAFPGMSVMQ